MHEMGITMSMLDIVKEKMDQNGADALMKVKIKVGELTAVEPDSLMFCFEVCTKGTPMEGAALEIEEVPLTGTCMECGERFHMAGFLAFCPSCDGAKIEEVTGTELEITSIVF